jgi:hypothetical protein
MEEEKTVTRPRIRSLYDWEIEEARCVFGADFDYRRVRIHEFNPWPNRINHIGLRLKKMENPHLDNAVTLGNHCFFPVQLPEQPVQPGDPQHYKLCWLIHELTHAWQFQRQGWMYLVRALGAQFKHKAHAYDYGGADALKLRREEGWTIVRFNLEQQGDIARDYYTRLRKGEDVSAWLPYIDDIQQKA